MCSSQWKLREGFTTDTGWIALFSMIKLQASSCVHLRLVFCFHFSTIKMRKHEASIDPPTIDRYGVTYPWGKTEAAHSSRCFGLSLCWVREHMAPPPSARLLPPRDSLVRQQQPHSGRRREEPAYAESYAGEELPRKVRRWPAQPERARHAALRRRRKTQNCNQQQLKTGSSFDQFCKKIQWAFLIRKS